MSEETTIKGMGALPHAGGVAFRVWAPNAQRVAVIGTFNVEEDDNQPGQFAAVAARLGHLKKLGVNAIQLLPVAQFAGERSWGYNPAQIFSVEIAYGGPLAFKRFVKRAHQQGIAVILDVVYNHLGPSDLDLWQFGGWSENNRGGIYSYNADRANTPWGDTRPDYGRGEVRRDGEQDTRILRNFLRLVLFPCRRVYTFS